MIDRLTNESWSVETLGWSEFFASQLDAKERARFEPARIVEAYRKRFLMHDGKEVFWALARGSMFHRAGHDPLALPAVGDWALVERIEGNPQARLWRTLDRRTALVRQAAGERTQAQVIAANLDHIFIVTSMNQEFNPRRIERYMSLAADSGARVTVVLNKSDLARHDEARADYIARAREAAPGALDIIASSMVTSRGVEALFAHVRPGETVGLIGSSGVGKSTIVNLLYGEGLQTTGEIREFDDMGRHTTTARQLIVLESGALLLDTPGMRELGLWQIDERDMDAFADIAALAAGCKFRDCRHDQESGCAVQVAVDAGELRDERVKSWQKLDAELAAQRERQRELERRPPRHTRRKKKK